MSNALGALLLGLVAMVLYSGVTDYQRATALWEARIAGLESDLAEAVHQNERCDHQVLQCQAGYVRVIQDIERVERVIERCIVLP